MTRDSDFIENGLNVRTHIAELLTGRCNNCYCRLPGDVGCSVHSPGWNWITNNFGPFCDECFSDFTNLRVAVASYRRFDAASGVTLPTSVQAVLDAARTLCETNKE